MGGTGSTSRPSDLLDRETSDGTLASRVAIELKSEIIERGWPVGEVLGSEAQLIQRFGVSRSVIREAERLLTSWGLAKSKPGPGGGLVVTAPSDTAIFAIARILFGYRGFATVHLFQAWAGIEMLLVEQLAGEISATGVADLRSALEDAMSAPSIRETQRTLHTEIARLSGNPVAEILVGTLNDVFHFHALQLPPDLRRSSYEQHVHLIDAIEAGDPTEASRTVRKIFKRFSDHIIQI
jgi:DNA-binding FadR family transcriptional regulator